MSRISTSEATFAARAERKVLETVEQETKQVDDTLAGLRVPESDFNRLKAAKLWIDLARSGTLTPRLPQPSDDNTRKLGPPTMTPPPLRLPPIPDRVQPIRTALRADNLNLISGLLQNGLQLIRVGGARKGSDLQIVSHDLGFGRRRIRFR